MMEKFKTALLVLLVAVSLFQSYLLAYSKPNFHPIDQDEYLDAKWTGPQKELEDIIFPEEIILHAGNDQHAIFRPSFQFYHLIFDKFKQRNFGRFVEIDIVQLNMPQLKTANQGMEFTFREPVAFATLAQILSLRPDAEEISDWVRNIWVTSFDSENIRVFFFTANRVYEAEEADLTMRDLEEFIGFAERMPEYRRWPDADFYIPESPIDATEVRLLYEKYNIEQLQKNLFVDPGTRRSLLERSGTEIYTDGKRGLEIYRSMNWMRFSDPVASSGSGQPVLSNLYSAIKFINRHGGWNGNYLLTHIYSGVVQTFHFREYYSPFPNQTALPILPSEGDKYGYMEVSTQQGTVSNYERSILSMVEEPVELRNVQLPGGDELRSMLEDYEGIGAVRQLIPAYQPVIYDEFVELIPKWAVRLDTNRYDFIH